MSYIQHNNGKYSCESMNR